MNYDEYLIEDLRAERERLAEKHANERKHLESKLLAAGYLIDSHHSTTHDHDDVAPRLSAHIVARDYAGKCADGLAYSYISHDAAACAALRQIIKQLEGSRREIFTKIQ